MAQDRDQPRRPGRKAMTVTSVFGAVAATYAGARPAYPAELFRALAELAGRPLTGARRRDRALDGHAERARHDLAGGAGRARGRERAAGARRLRGLRHLRAGVALGRPGSGPPGGAPRAAARRHTRGLVESHGAR